MGLSESIHQHSSGVEPNHRLAEQCSLNTQTSFSKALRPGVDMPRRLVIVRHGESQANVINRQIKSGAITSYPPEFITTPDREVRLTSAGVVQADKTGTWLATRYPQGFAARFVSNHVRAMETAAHLAEGAGWLTESWKIEPLLGERNWGNYQQLPPEERARVMALRQRDPNYCPMPDGETLLETRLRSRELLNGLGRYSGRDILIVTHGEFAEALWSEIVHMSTERQIDFFSSRDGKIGNCQVIEFSAEDPETDEWNGKLRWVTSSCPHEGKAGNWKRLQSEVFLPAQLRATVNRYMKFPEEWMTSVPQPE